MSEQPADAPRPQTLWQQDAFQDWAMAVKKNLKRLMLDRHPLPYDGLAHIHNDLPDVLGVYWSPTAIFLAIYKDISANQSFKVYRTFLEFSVEPMARLSIPSEPPDNVDFWYWTGAHAPERFTFSFDFGDGRGKHWAWITSAIPTGAAKAENTERRLYKPWEHADASDPHRDPGTLVGGVYVDNQPSREAYRVERRTT